MSSKTGVQWHLNGHLDSQLISFGESKHTASDMCACHTAVVCRRGPLWNTGTLFLGHLKESERASNEHLCGHNERVGKGVGWRERILHLCECRLRVLVVGVKNWIDPNPIHNWE